MSSIVEVSPPKRELTRPSFIKYEDVRSIAIERLIQRYGVVSARTIAAVEYRVGLCSVCNPQRRELMAEGLTGYRAYTCLSAL